MNIGWTEFQKKELPILFTMCSISFGLHNGYSIYREGRIWLRKEKKNQRSSYSCQHKRRKERVFLDIGNLVSVFKPSWMKENWIDHRNTFKWIVSKHMEVLPVEVALSHICIRHSSKINSHPWNLEDYSLPEISLSLKRKEVYSNNQALQQIAHCYSLKKYEKNSMVEFSPLNKISSTLKHMREQKWGKFEDDIGRVKD